MNNYLQKRITDDEALDMLKNMSTPELMSRAREIQTARH